MENPIQFNPIQSNQIKSNRTTRTRLHGTRHSHRRSTSGSPWTHPPPVCTRGVLRPPARTARAGKQTNKQTIKQTNKQAGKQTNKQNCTCDWCQRRNTRCRNCIQAESHHTRRETAQASVTFWQGRAPHNRRRRMGRGVAGRRATLRGAAHVRVPAPHDTCRDARRRRAHDPDRARAAAAAAAGGPPRARRQTRHCPKTTHACGRVRRRPSPRRCTLPRTDTAAERTETAVARGGPTMTRPRARQRALASWQRPTAVQI